MKYFKRLMIGLSVLVSVAWSVSATAAPIVTYFGDCSGDANCFGSTYTLVIGDANDAVSTTYTATLRIDTSGYNGPITNAFVDAVDVKVVNIISNGPVLVDAPGGAANWQVLFNSGQAATDCGAGGGFFICARDPNPNDLAPVGGILNWTWTFSSSNTISFGHIGASYNNAAGTIQGNNTSIGKATTDIPRVPEPSALFLVGSGLVVLAVVGRRYRRK